MYTKRGKYKFVALFLLFINRDTNNEKDPTYAPPGRHSLSGASRTTRGTPLKVNPDVVIASQFEEEQTLTGSPTRAASILQGGST